MALVGEILERIHAANAYRILKVRPIHASITRLVAKPLKRI